MISWSSIAYGAVLSALLAGLAGAASTRGRRGAAALTAAAGAGLGPLAWNAILRATDANQFFHDAPVAAIPASWQDTGSGVFAIAATALLAGIGPLHALPARRATIVSVVAGIAAFLVDVYLY